MANAALNYPPETIVNVGFLSAVFGDRDKNKNKLFRGGTKAPDKNYFMLMQMESALLQWYNTNFPTNTDISTVANYVLGLEGNYLGEALSALGNAGGIVVNPTTGSPINLAQFRYDFTIGDSGSLMTAGDTSLTINLSGVFLAQFQPSGINETIGDDSQASLNGIIYNAAYVRFNLNQAVVDGERYIVWGLRATAGTIAGGGGSGVQLPQPYKKGQFLTNDGTNLLWDDVWIAITAADFESDGKTYNNAALAGYYLGVNWVNNSSWLNFETGEATLLEAGGFVVNLDGFDATQNPDWSFKIFKKSLPSS